MRFLYPADRKDSETDVVHDPQRQAGTPTNACGECEGNMLQSRPGLTVRRFVAPRHRRRLLLFVRFRAQMSGMSWRYLGYLAVQVAAVAGRRSARGACARR